MTLTFLSGRGEVTNQGIAVVLLGIALSACSDSAAPSPGTFSAQLREARVARLTGPAIAEESFTLEFPELQFGIRMHAPHGDTITTIAIRCRGTEPPAAGTHTIDVTGEDCVASYSRVLSAQAGTAVLESAAATSGAVNIGTSPPGQLEGTFSLQGTLQVGSDSVGILKGSGSFSAELL